jgi:hypothetical protein
MVSFCYLLVGLILAALCVAGAAAQEPSQRPAPTPPSSAPSNETLKLEGINCTYGIACPIVSIPVPDVPLETIKPSPLRP